MTATSTPSAIIQKIPVARTKIKEVPLNVSDETSSSLSTQDISTETTSTTIVSIPDPTELIQAINVTTTTEQTVTSSVTSSIPVEFSETSHGYETTSPNSDIESTSVHIMETSDSSIDLFGKCPDLSKLPDIDLLTQDEFITKLTDSCRYDRLVKPQTNEPLEVTFQIDMMHVESSDHLVSKLSQQLSYCHIYYEGFRYMN